MKLDRHLVLTGPMASGKTTLGRILAHELNRPFIDSDNQIRASHGITASELAARADVETLHSAEAAALVRALAEPDPAVIAAAASVAESDVAHAALAASAALVVLLQSPMDILVARLAHPSRHRRLVSPADMESSASVREAALRDLDPVLVLDTSRQSPEQSADEILEAIAGEIGLA